MPETENKVKKSFFQNMRAELKKVIWPTGKQTVKSTAATIAFVLLIAAILIALNTIFDIANKYLLDLIIK
jgi:preprotein translocase SecE subunit